MAQLSEIPNLIEDGWIMRCLRGHADIRDKQGPTVYCRSCGSGYHCEELVDTRKR